MRCRLVVMSVGRLREREDEGLEWSKGIEMTRLYLSDILSTQSNNHLSQRRTCVDVTKVTE